MLSTFPKPTIVAVMPDTVPVNAGEAKGAFNAKSVFDAFASKAVCVAVETGLSRSAVLSTFPNPTFEALIPAAIFASVTFASKILAVVIFPSPITGKSDVPVKSPDNCILPFVLILASGIAFEAIAASTYIFVAFSVGYFKSELDAKVPSVLLLATFSFEASAVVARVVSAVNALELV